MKHIQFSRHARRRMRLYEISVDHVNRTLAEPEQLVSCGKGRYNAFRRLGDWLVRVTYLEEEKSITEVTVTPRKVPKP